MDLGNDMYLGMHRKGDLAGLIPVSRGIRICVYSRLVGSCGSRLSSDGESSRRSCVAKGKVNLGRELSGCARYWE